MKRIKNILFVLVLGCLILAGCADSTAPKIKNAPKEYDFDSGKDYVFTADLKGYKECTLYIGETRLDKTEYTYDENKETFTVSAYSLMYLELGKSYEFKLETEGGSATFNVKMVSASNLSMDTGDVVFDHSKPEDLVLKADFGEQKIENIRLGSKNYADPKQYSYSEKDKTLTLKKDLLMTLAGETNILVRLENGKEFSFNLKSTMLAYADFEDAENNAVLTNNYGMFWGTTIEQADGKDGNHVGRIHPEYDHLFVFGNHYWGAMGNVTFEKGKSYTVEFDVKPEETSSAKSMTIYLRKAFESYDPRCGIDPAGEGDDVQKYFTLDFGSGSVKGEGDKDFVTYTYDEKTGYAHVKIEFKTVTSYDMILNANTGSFYYDGDRPGEKGSTKAPTNADNLAAREQAKGICWLFDNMSVSKSDSSAK